MIEYYGVSTGDRIYNRDWVVVVDLIENGFVYYVKRRQEEFVWHKRRMPIGMFIEQAMREADKIVLNETEFADKLFE